MKLVIITGCFTAVLARHQSGHRVRDGEDFARAPQGYAETYDERAPEAFYDDGHRNTEYDEDMDEYDENDNNEDKSAWQDENEGYGYEPTLRPAQNSRQNGNYEDEDAEYDTENYENDDGFDDKYADKYDQYDEEDEDLDDDEHDNDDFEDDETDGYPDTETEVYEDFEPSPSAFHLYYQDHIFLVCFSFVFALVLFSVRMYFYSKLRNNVQLVQFYTPAMMKAKQAPEHDDRIVLSSGDGNEKEAFC